MHRSIATQAPNAEPPQGTSGQPRHHMMMVGAHVAGCISACRNTTAALESRGDVEVQSLDVVPYRADGFIERHVRFLPTSTRGTLRSVIETGPLFRGQYPDVVWTQVDIPMLPWLYSRALAHHAPLIYSCDSTPALLRQFGAHYHNWGGGSSAKVRLRDGVMRLCFSRMTAFTPWSRWAMRSLRDDYGVPDSKLVVSPPGVDTQHWHPADSTGTRTPGPARILFVGGDFARKGGDLLLEVYRAHLRGKAEIDFVTHLPDAQPEPGVRYHTQLGPNDPALRRLYQEADMMVLPTRADCFSMAGIEAMASGLPVIITPVGGIAELFEDGREGFFIPVDDGRALSERILTLLDDVSLRRSMGVAARRLACARYDAQSHASQLLSLVHALRAGARTAETTGFPSTIA